MWPVHLSSAAPMSNSLNSPGLIHTIGMGAFDVCFEVVESHDNNYHERNTSLIELKLKLKYSIYLVLTHQIFNYNNAIATPQLLTLFRREPSESYRGCLARVLNYG